VLAGLRALERLLQVDVVRRPQNDQVEVLAVDDAVDIGRRLGDAPAFCEALPVLQGRRGDDRNLPPSNVLEAVEVEGVDEAAAEQADANGHLASPGNPWQSGEDSPRPRRILPRSSVPTLFSMDQVGRPRV